MYTPEYYTYIPTPAAEKEEREKQNTPSPAQKRIINLTYSRGFLNWSAGKC